ncbi:WD40 repeat domain-containing protein [Rubinisphaera sp.]|uniref:WD40 repeat domain-containing protein n=1 Tax=Rubinisphaera sp. TaxID=2024857 RepID=UPI000C0CB317|nr:WD40 repeat domain-containing protein [Rubinisphaera sp.]MBV10796.1 hypothetical protein [Rubinisphaera sp.]HCS50212.1 hypothetical protein [Planctomycetaceae bacterium]|tara:strand:- start:155 stop:1117 length:963 start_codon:yes stop_codon:yes gene_type:complete
MNHIHNTRQFAQFLLSIIVFNGASVLLANEPVVTALVITPDGKQVVAAQDSQLRFFEIATLSTLATVDFELASIHDIRFSPDGKMLAVAGGNPGEDGIVQVCHYPFEQAGAVYRIHKDSVYSIRWLPDSNRIVTGSLDGNVNLFDRNKNSKISEFHGHSKGVTAVEMLPGEKILVTASVDQSLRVWDIITRKNIRTFNNHTGAINDLKISPHTEGLPTVVTIANDRTVRFWQPTIGRMVRFVKLESIPLAVVWHPREPMIVVTTSTGLVFMIDSQSAAIVKRIQTNHSWLHAVVIDPAGENVIVANNTGLQKFSLLQIDQ